MQTDTELEHPSTPPAENLPKVEGIFSPPFMIDVESVVESDDEPRLTSLHMLDIETLAKGMAENGGQPWDAIKVEKLPDGKWLRLAGKRRLAAAKMNGLKLIRAEEFTGTPLQRELFMLGDNMNRRDMTTFEVANRLGEIKKKYKLATPKLVVQMEKMGFTKQYSVAHIDTLIGYMNKAHPLIMVAWRDNDQRITTDFLKWVTTKTPADQEKIWKDVAAGAKWKAIKDKEELEAEKAARPTKAPSPYMPMPPKGKKIMAQVWGVVQEHVATPVLKDLQSFVNFLMGESSVLYVGGKKLASVENGKFIPNADPLGGIPVEQGSSGKGIPVQQGRTASGGKGTPVQQGSGKAARNRNPVQQGRSKKAVSTRMARRVMKARSKAVVKTAAAKRKK